MPLSIRLEGDGIDSFSLSLDRFGDNVSDLRPAFNDMADEFVALQRANFGGGGSVYGAWSPLSPVYAAWKAVHYPGRPILTRTGALRDDLTQRPLAVENIDPHRMELGTDREYAAYHQRGTARMPQRKIINQPSPSEKRQYGKILHTHAFAGVDTA